MTLEKVQEIRETIQEAFEEKDDLNCNIIGLYNYIRYANDDFGEDMVINDIKPITNNSKIQHCYIVIFINECIKKGYEIPDCIIREYENNSEKYNDMLLEQEIKQIKERIRKA